MASSATIPAIIKVGGALMGDAAAAKVLLENIKQVSATRPVVLVHGGGPLVEEVMAGLGLVSAKIDGLRVTPDEHMPYICGALAGSANKSLCATAIAVGLKPVGLSLLDADMTKCTEMDEKYGAVGIPQANDDTLPRSLLAQGLFPIISSIGSSDEGRLLNINGDQAGTVIAQLLKGELFLLSNVEGVLDDTKQLIPKLDQAGIDHWVANGVITDGMKVKVDAAMEAAKEIGQPVTIASWAAPLADVMQHASGTQIIPE